ncbi:MAG: AMP-binding protein [Spirochaetales bacterium]|nr:AMP-binding protein [Leptospiraceae bacterium]MCP5482383.1 AMP-binding protein [Spirochaetales bacterium]MCP5484178.1 AMP-binding protein [Spirochaetales bacterium]
MQADNGYTAAVERRELDNRTLAAAFLEQARRDPRRAAIIDPGGDMSRIRLAGASLALRDLLDDLISSDRVGVLLPPGKGGAIVNLALALGGKTSVNLNHTTGEDMLARMCEIAEVSTILSARRYLERIEEIELPGRVILVDDELLPRVSKARVLARMARVILGGAAGLDRAHPDEVATILFSSGTTGDPKGIQLTHAQVLANIEAVLAALKLDEDDIMLSALPLFHSFGLVPGMWLGLIGGPTIAAYPNPREAAGLVSFARKTRATAMLSTPTFCRVYMKKANHDEFESLRFAVVGAEKCPADLKQEFRRRFDTELLEGYGCTELSPVVSANLLDSHVTDRFEKGSRTGSVGRPLPGIEVRIVDPETHRPLPTGSEGLIVVRSPSRMLGYLKRPDLTEQAFLQGGYNTGDMGRLDEDGFLFITGRLARFAKIGGEMVPLDTVEERLAANLNALEAGDEAELAVAAVPDQNKGERLVVLHTAPATTPEQLLQNLEDLPAIFRPRPRDFHTVESLPVLGTGKRDLKGLRELALKLCAPKNE